MDSHSNIHAVCNFSLLDHFPLASARLLNPTQTPVTLHFVYSDPPIHREALLPRAHHCFVLIHLCCFCYLSNELLHGKRARERERETQFSMGGLEGEGANSVGFWMQESSISFSSALHRTDAVNYNCSQIPDLPELNSQSPFSASGDQQPARKSGRCLLGCGRSWAGHGFGPRPKEGTVM